MNTKVPNNRPSSLAKLVDAYQESGKYCLLRTEAQTFLKCSDEALKKAAERLVSKQRLVIPRRGFYVIIPLEYRTAGAPPPTWFIHELMQFHNCSYYVGLLSAAALHGAAHQQPQEFQVVTSTQLRPLKVGRARIRFFTKHQMPQTGINQVKTETGFMLASAPETTAIDLLKYLEGAGHVNHVAGVLHELKGALNGEKLLIAAQQESELAHAQRLGYLLDLVGADPLLTAPLERWIAKKCSNAAALRPDRPILGAPTDEKWKVRVNEKIEVDEL